MAKHKKTETDHSSFSRFQSHHVAKEVPRTEPRRARREEKEKLRELSVLRVRFS